MQRFRNILVSVDSRDEKLPALELGVKLAEDYGAKLTVIDTVREFPWYVQLAMPDHAHMRDLLLRDKQESLAAAVQPLRDRGLNIEHEVLVVPRTSEELIRRVLRDGHDLVIRVSKGQGSSRLGYFGTTSRRLLRKCPCPVWIVKPDRAPAFGRVLAAVDPVTQDAEHKELNHLILNLGESISRSQQGEMLVAYVWSIYGEELLRPRMRRDEWEKVDASIRAEMEEALSEVLAPHGIPLRDSRVHLIKGDAGSMIPLFIRNEKIDLLVMGTVGRGGVSGALMGNTAELILDSVECAVLALKPSTFQCPVTLPAE